MFREEKHHPTCTKYYIFGENRKTFCRTVFGRVAKEALRRKSMFVNKLRDGGYTGAACLPPLLE